MWHGYFLLTKAAGFNAENKQELSTLGDQTPTESCHITMIIYRLDSKEAICEMRLNSEPQASDFSQVGIDTFSMFNGGEEQCSSVCCHDAAAYFTANQAQWYEEE